MKPATTAISSSPPEAQGITAGLFTVAPDLVTVQK